MFKSVLTLCWISLAIVTQVDCNDNSAVFAHCFPSALLPLFLDGSNISFLTFFTINIFARTPILWVPPSACSWLKQVSYSPTSCLSAPPSSPSSPPPPPQTPAPTPTLSSGSSESQMLHVIRVCTANNIKTHSTHLTYETQFMVLFKFWQLHFVNINMIKSWQSSFAEQLVAHQTWLDPHLPSFSSSSRPASRSFSPSALSANTPPSTVLAGEGSASSGDQSSTDQWLAATCPTHPLVFLPTTGSSASPKEKHNHPIDFKWLIVTANQTRFYSSSIKLPLSLVQMVKSGRQVKSLFLVGHF